MAISGFRSSALRHRPRSDVCMGPDRSMCVWDLAEAQLVAHAVGDHRREILLELLAAMKAYFLLGRGK